MHPAERLQAVEHLSALLLALRSECCRLQAKSEPGEELFRVLDAFMAACDDLMIGLEIDTLPTISTDRVG